MNNLRFVITRSAMTIINWPHFNFQLSTLTMGLPQNFVLRDDNNSLLASDARGLKAGVGEVVSKFDKHLGGCDGVVNGAVGVV